MTNGSSSRPLGKAGFGTVYLGKLENGKEVAVKILNRSSQQGIPEFLNEVNLLRRANHVNLVRLLGHCQDEEQVLIYEFAEEGSVWDHLLVRITIICEGWKLNVDFYTSNSRERGKLDVFECECVQLSFALALICATIQRNTRERKWLDWKQRLSIALQSACGLEYLHTLCSPRIIHRDIKSENILLTKTMVAKVADFGSSRLGADHDNNWKTHVTTKVMGTRGYQLDPQYRLTGPLRDSSDVYSFGIVLLEIITGRKPHPILIPKATSLTGLGSNQDNNWKTHVSTKVMGTRGYLDPEYHLNGQLRDSSDVYSFGIVLLEIVTGRKPVPNSDVKCCITNWVEKTYGSGGSKTVKAVVDPLFSDNYDPRALKLVINVARSCIKSSGESRPKISEVVRALRKAQALEVDERKSWFPNLDICCHSGVASTIIVERIVYCS